MDLPFNSTAYLPLLTRDATGAPANATGTPTASIRVNGASSAVTVTVANTGTGRYELSFSTASFSYGDQLTVIASAVIAGVAREAVYAHRIERAVISSGSGPYAVTVHVVDDDDVDLAGAAIRLTSGGTSYYADTDADGEAAFSLAAGTYQLTVAKAGYQHTPAAVVVDGDDTVESEMVATDTITPSDGPETTAAYCYTYDGQGVIQGSVILSFCLLGGTGTGGVSYEGDWFDVTSNAGTGLLAVSLLRSSRYKVRRGRHGHEYTFTTPDSATYALPETVGRALA